MYFSYLWYTFAIPSSCGNPIYVGRTISAIVGLIRKIGYLELITINNTDNIDYMTINKIKCGGGGICAPSPKYRIVPKHLYAKYMFYTIRDNNKILAVTL